VGGVEQGLEDGLVFREKLLGQNDLGHILADDDAAGDPAAFHDRYAAYVLVGGLAAAAGIDVDGFQMDGVAGKDAVDLAAQSRGRDAGQFLEFSAHEIVAVALAPGKIDQVPVVDESNEPLGVDVHNRNRSKLYDLLAVGRKRFLATHRRYITCRMAARQATSRASERLFGYFFLAGD